MVDAATDLPQRSSSPLKRRASSMEPEVETPLQNEVEMDTPHIDRSAEDNSSRYPRAMSVDLPENDNSGVMNASSRDIPPLTEQVKVIETLIRAAEDTPLAVDAVAYVVSRAWLGDALPLQLDSKNSKKGLEDVLLGPVDNSDIIEEIIKDPNGDDFARLKPGTGQESFELFPPDAWELVVSWYGIKDGQVAIPRRAINTAIDAMAEPNIIYELHPPIFQAHRLWSLHSPLPIEQSLKAANPPPLRLVRSRKYHAQTFLKELKTALGVPMDRKARLFAINQPVPVIQEEERDSAMTPPKTPERADATQTDGPWSKLLVDVKTYMDVPKEFRSQVPCNDRTGDRNFNGKSTLQHIELVMDSTIVLDEAIDTDWVSSYTRNGSGRGIPTRSGAGVLARSSGSGRASPVQSGPMTRGRGLRKRGSGRSVGAVGLHNLGNTCYMNSALQCVRSVEELTKYFLIDEYLEEINKVNPLGYHGRVATAYGGLLKEIYAEGRGSVSPREFKSTVGRCRSTFSGWGQQDSQEFLGFLLDGLQEDLSRVKKKPYIEKPDSTDDMIHNPDAIKQMADQVWDITRKRDDSVIADLFTGMYKSTLKCPECGKISITFDPFNNLTLPIPVEDLWSRPVKFYPLNDKPVKFEAELPKHSAMEALKQFISDRTGVPVKRLMGAEEFKSSFFKIYDNNSDVYEEIGHSDVPAIHELEAEPTNWPANGPVTKYRSMLDIDTPLDKEDERCEMMVVPVLHRRTETFNRSDSGCPPHFITLSRRETRDIDLIKRKVLEKLASFSTWTRLGAKVSNQSDDFVITNASDVDSSEDSKVAAISVESEDGLVDVSMKDTQEKGLQPNGPVQEQSKILRQFNARRPKYISHDVFLDSDLQSLFDLSYFATPNEHGPVPTGWNSVDGRALPKLSDRIPQAQEPEEADAEEEEDGASPTSWNSANSNNEESSNEESTQPDSAQTRMADESSEEGDNMPARFARNARTNRKKMYGKRGNKANKRREKQMRSSKLAKQRMPNAKIQPQPQAPAVADGGPLIRLGEGLLVEWTEDAWERVFGMTSANTNPDEQGTKTFVDVETVPDPALKAMQRRRQSRRSRGITLDECLDEFARAEVLSEQDMWYCPRCKEHRRASKKFDLWKTPDYLVAHLKRFSSSGYRRDKLDVLVDFPIEGLDLTSRVIQKEDGKEEVYDLIAVDDHYGGLGGGHYTAYAKNFVDGCWYNYNDSSVSQISDPQTAVTSAAYLLFYRRRSKRPLGGSRFAEILGKYENEEGESGQSGDEDRRGGSPDVFGDHPGLNRNSTRTDNRPLVVSDDEEHEGQNIQRSIEDDGGRASLNLTQGWNFQSIEEDGSGDSPRSDVPIQMSDGRARSPASLDGDTEMESATELPPWQEPSSPPAADEIAQITLADIQNATWAQKGVISVPAGAGSDNDSTEVAEIHLESDK